MANQIVTTGSPAKKIATAATQAGGGSNNTFDDGFVHNNWTLQIVYSGTPTSPSIQLQGSLDGGNHWFNMGTAYTTTTSGAVVVADTPAQQVRATVGGTTVTTDLFLACVG